jgi:hypothetical protein
MSPAMSARVDNGITRSSRLRASWHRAGNVALIRGCVWRASNTTSPVM